MTVNQSNFVVDEKLTRRASLRLGRLVSDRQLENLAAGWRLTGANTGPEPECVVVDAAGGALSQPWPSIGPPIIAIVTDDMPPELMDRCDGFILPGDDAATAGRILDAAVQAPGGFAVGDFADSTAAAIGALSADASRIAEALQSLAARAVPGEPQPVTAASVRRLLRLRRERERFLPAMLFADPAWDMLLDLTVARLERRDVPVSSLCIAASVPTTTALRWIRTMTEAGLFERYSDPGDARRSHIRLTDTAADAMLDWLRLFNSQLAPR